MAETSLQRRAPRNPPAGETKVRLSPEALIERFRELHRLSLHAQERAPDQLFDDYLASGLRLLGLEFALLSRIQGRHYSIVAAKARDGESPLTPGDTFPLSETYCSLVVATGKTVAIEAVGASPELSGHPAYERWQLEAYIAAPIWVGGTLWGTLNFTAAAPYPRPFHSEDTELLELMAQSLAHVIERDLIERRRAQDLQKLHETTELFENAFHYAPIGIALVAPDGRWLRVNPALCQIVGYTEQELLAIDFQTITHPDDLDTDLALVQEMLEGKRNTYQMEKRYFHKDGHVVWVLLSVSLARNEDGSPRYFISQIHDITEQKRLVEELYRERSRLQIANRNLQRLAGRDALTQVMNRLAFDKRLKEELSRAQREGTPLSLLMVDVDHFKRFNDEHGHAEGDRALQAVARTLVSGSREHDVVARYGGEEFVVLLPATDAVGARVAAERLRRAVEEIDGLARRVTISVGCATLLADAESRRRGDPSALLAAADQALYAAKNAGRNCVRSAELQT